MLVKLTPETEIKPILKNPLVLETTLSMYL